MSKQADKYYVVTDEGIEGSGQTTPLEALIEYIEFDEVTVDRINEILEAKSEIHYVRAFSRAELNNMIET